MVKALEEFRSGNKKPDLNVNEFLKHAHLVYMELGALNATAEWLNRAYDINVNRYKLARVFHANDLHVNPPNGKPILYYGKPKDTYQSPWHEMAGAWLELLHKDLTEEPKYSINWVSACYALGSPMYNTMLLLLQGGKDVIKSLPANVDELDIVLGRTIYELQQVRWLGG